MQASLVTTQPRQADVSRSSIPPNTCGKKRVRRIQMELPYFRSQAKDLELQLKRLKLQRLSSVVETVPPRPVQALTERLPPRRQASVWNGFAERQFKERLRAERQQQELKDKQDELRNLSEALQQLLQRWDCQKQEVAEKVTKAKQLRYWDFNAGPEDEVFADQLAVATRIRLEMQRLRLTPCRTLTLGSGLSMGPELVRWDPSVKAGFTLEVQCGSMLPFSLKVAADAYWRFFVCGYHSHSRYGPDHLSRKEPDLSVETVARSFKIRTDFEGFTSNAIGKYTARKFVDEDGGVTITCAGSEDIHEFDGVAFSGIQMHRRGCIKLRPVPRQGPGQQSTSTVVEVSMETIPIFHDSVVDKAQQTQKLLDGIDNSYIKVDKLFCQRMGALLLEEDWKATFGRE